jgi:hypothetical protein
MVTENSHGYGEKQSENQAGERLGAKNMLRKIRRRWKVDQRARCCLGGRPNLAEGKERRAKRWENLQMRVESIVEPLSQLFPEASVAIQNKGKRQKDGWAER